MRPLTDKDMYYAGKVLLVLIALIAFAYLTNN